MKLRNRLIKNKKELSRILQIFMIKSKLNLYYQKQRKLNKTKSQFKKMERKQIRNKKFKKRTKNPSKSTPRTELKKFPRGKNE